MTKLFKFFDKLVLLTMLLPVLVCVLSITPIIIAIRMKLAKTVPDRLKKSWKDAVNLFYYSLLFCMFLTYPMISYLVLSTFHERLVSASVLLNGLNICHVWCVCGMYA